MKKDFPLSKITRFRVGGTADYLFQPDTPQELAAFLPQNTLPITVIGSASNILVRDGGIRGVVIKLGKGFSHQNLLPKHVVRIGAATSNRKLVSFCKEHSLGGLEFMYHIPSTLGGALYMNAGAYGHSIAECLVQAELMDTEGNVHQLSADDLGYAYRTCRNLPKGWFFLSAIFQGIPSTKESIEEVIAEYDAKRSAQPWTAITCGSTFKNPSGAPAWKLIDEAGCRGLSIGGAQVSAQHCNFIINDGTATAADIEALGEEVRKRVKETSGVTLEWEVQILGEN